MPYKDPEKRRLYHQTPAGLKSNRISKWKRRGIISDDYDALYERFMSTQHCDKCGVVLTSGGRTTRTTKCVDHDHSIKDRENVRAIICNACNINDKCTNTSGVPNVHYDNTHDCWQYKSEVNKVRHQRCFKTKDEAIRYKYKYES